MAGLRLLERESGHEPLICEDCVPQREPPHAHDADYGHTAKLGRDILDYVVEVAVIHLDNDDLRYDLTVEEIGLLMAGIKSHASEDGSAEDASTEDGAAHVN